MALIEDPVELWEAYEQDASLANRNALVEHYLVLVEVLAAKVMAGLLQVDVDDLVAYGTFGLIEALPKFERSRGLRFSSYANLRIRGAMFDAIRDYDWVPRLVRKRVKRMQEAGERFFHANGRPATPPELAAELGISESELGNWNLEAVGRGVTSLEDPVRQAFEDSHRSAQQSDLIQDPRSENPLDKRFDIENCKELLKGMNKVERVVFIQYYWENQTMRKIGQQLGLSESRISQIHTDCINRIRESHGLPPMAKKSTTGRRRNSRQKLAA